MKKMCIDMKDCYFIFFFALEDDLRGLAFDARDFLAREEGVLLLPLLALLLLSRLEPRFAAFAVAPFFELDLSFEKAAFFDDFSLCTISSSLYIQ